MPTSSSSPRKYAVVAALAALFASALALTYFGHLTDYAEVSGKIQAVGRTKVIEPRALGRVMAIHANDGDTVQKDDVLVELDPTGAQADRQVIADQIANLNAQIARQQTEIQAARADPIVLDPSIAWADTIPADMRARETAVMRADLAELNANLTNLTAQVNAVKASRDKYTDNITAQNALLAVTTERSAMNETLQRQGWNSQLAVLNAQETLMQQKTALTQLQASLANAEAALPVLESRIATTRETFVADKTQAIATAQRQLDDLAQQLVKADQAVAYMTLRAPVAGVVHATSVTTLGQVVKPGQQLMQVVPQDVPLEIIGYVPNTDIGFIKTGQSVEIKLDTFEYSTYGTIPGVITSVGADAMPADTKKSTLQSASLDGSIDQTTAAQKTGNLVYPVTVRALRASINIGGKEVPLAPGMAATVDIKTEDRRAIDYVLSPIINVFATAAHEQ